MQGVRNISNTDSILFNKGDGNYVAKGKLTGDCIWEDVVIAENEAINMSKFDTPADGQPFILPEKVVWKYPLGMNEFLELNENKYGLIQFRRLPADDWEFGWIDSVKHIPEDGEAEFTLTTKV